MTKKDKKNLSEKIRKGVDLAYKRLVIKRQKEDGELIFSEDGKIVRVKAKDLTQ